MKKFLLIFLYLLTTIIFSQTTSPKREFRGAWIATVTNIDWPVRGASTESQKQALIDILDKLKLININAIMFQVRPECDALYKSDLEPWSYWLTGVQGKAPEPFYDPLQFAITEAHKRGMELHAWFNPYRVERSVGNYSTASNHISKTHPEWTFTKGTVKILDPGLPQVRNYVLSVIMDVVRRYNIDAVHFDDYFYLDGMGNEDYNTYLTYGGFASLGDWRRENVNTLIKMINDSIKAVKPYVKWGISPRGIWRPGYPAGITGNDNYNSIYCDAMAWLQTKTIDYINPQLYWAFGGGQDYGKLMPWWADSAGVNGRHMYVGHAVYRINNPFTSSEIPRQIRLNRTDTDCHGSVMYNTTSTLANLLGFYDSLKVLYKNPALIPNMSWKDQIKPNNPQNLRWQKLASTRGDGLIWDAPVKASDGDTASSYAIYNFTSAAPQQSDIDKASNLYNIVGNTFTTLRSAENITGTTMYFAVTSLDRNYNESGISNVVPVQINVPRKPLQIFPPDNAVNQRDSIKFVWENTPGSNYNRFQIASDSAFTNKIVSLSNVTDTFKVVTVLKGLTTYYWRITASNILGESVPSDVRLFKTGFPNPPILLIPLNDDTVKSFNSTIVWRKSIGAAKYKLQIAKGQILDPSTIILDTMVVDTSIILNKLKTNSNYSWSVKAINEYGSSQFSSLYHFTTSSILGIESGNEVPLTFSLNQNFPNPFNPNTTISFTISKRGFTTLKIYDSIGRIVEVLVNKELQPGEYKYNFTSKGISSGVYYYILSSGNSTNSKKMLLLK